MIPTSVQTTADTQGPLLPYALAALGFTACFLLLGWICVGGPQRLLRSWLDAKRVINEAAAFCAQADRQGQR